MTTPPPKKWQRTRIARRPKTPPTFRGFVHVNEAVASGAEPLKLLLEFAKIYTDHLVLDDSQREAVLVIYADNDLFSQKYDIADEQDQLTARAFLTVNHLDTNTLDKLGSKWSCRWSSSKGTGDRATQRQLYQCYSHTACGSDKQSNPVNFTGCLGHCKVLYRIGTHQVLMIRGYLEHNKECLTSAFTWSPVWPVHPSVYRHALQLLESGASLVDAKKANQHCGAKV
ncbi:hypothetical protein BC835DRAFT_1311093 [Cytidiella melzeri]|nr:hypothetical protein BC835DRAFT_1311093 [Cytidiella melzeri]